MQISHGVCPLAPGRDPALRYYDQAIAALDAVNAEYTLGLACQERAQFLAKLGSHDKAEVDLAKARHFASVDAEGGGTH